MTGNSSRASTSFVVVGDVMVDQLAPLAGPLTPGRDNPTHVRRELGGQAANSAAWLATIRATDDHVHLVGAVGDDHYGRWVSTSLAACGVSADLARTSEPTGQCFITITPDGDRTMFPDPGANTSLDARFLSKVIENIRRTDDSGSRLHLHLSGYLTARLPEVADVALSVLDSDGCISIDTPSLELDPHQRHRLFDLLVRCDLLFANAEEIAALAGAPHSSDGVIPAASVLEQHVANFRDLSSFAGVVVVKAGAHGSYASAPGIWSHAHAERTNVIDTTGAGDAFAAGFLATWRPASGGELATDESLSVALASGSSVAARAVSRIGAGPTAGSVVQQYSEKGR